MKEKIIEFLNSKEQNLNLGYVLPADVEQILTDNGAEYGDIETNGWEHEFWSYFTYNTEKLVFSGSWYYGNYNLARKN